jgi:hypothetical protein
VRPAVDSGEVVRRGDGDTALTVDRGQTVGGGRGGGAIKRRKSSRRGEWRAGGEEEGWMMRRTGREEEDKTITSHAPIM